MSVSVTWGFRQGLGDFFNMRIHPQHTGFDGRYDIPHKTNNG
jgi:hypothetical protein